VEQEAPLISSSVAGPLGVTHLPRVWLKILLHAAGRLPEGYRHGAGGFDELLCTNLGIDRDAFVAYIENEQPGYAELEDWVKANATNLNAESIAKHNAAILGRDLPPNLLEERRTALGITDPSLTKAVTLNDLDDWAAAHRRITSLRAER
jgi:hypothetical protein